MSDITEYNLLAELDHRARHVDNIQSPDTSNIYGVAASEIRRLHATNAELLETLKYARASMFSPDKKVDEVIAKHEGTD